MLDQRRISVTTTIDPTDLLRVDRLIPKLLTQRLGTSAPLASRSNALRLVIGRGLDALEGVAPLGNDEGPRGAA